MLVMIPMGRADEVRGRGERSAMSICEGLSGVEGSATVGASVLRSVVIRWVVKGGPGKDAY